MAEDAKALILDFGSVVTLTMFETHRFSERNLGLPTGSLTWMGPFDPEGDVLWQSMQRDEITEREYWLARARETGSLLGENWTEMAQFVVRARGQNTHEIIRPEIEPLICALKAEGKKLAILSNELDLFFGVELRQSLRFLKHFDIISDATYTHVLKPDPKAYHACVGDLGLRADELCLSTTKCAMSVEGWTSVCGHCISMSCVQETPLTLP